MSGAAKKRDIKTDTEYPEKMTSEYWVYNID